MCNFLYRIMNYLKETTLILIWYYHNEIYLLLFPKNKDKFNNLLDLNNTTNYIKKYYILYIV